MLEAFVRKQFYSSSQRMIERANSIIAEMSAMGYTLTVRQLYYQFVSRDWLKNTLQNYKRLASVIDDARKAGLIDWDSIEDRTRYLRDPVAYANPQDFLNRRIEGYAEDLWRNQDVYCEVWIEKDALIGVIERPCHEWRVPYFACRGYASSSELYTAGKRLMWAQLQGKQCIVFHLGDHDPSGIDMTRCNQDALSMYSGSAQIEVQRLALNIDQVEHYKPPPNFAKPTDSRYAEYVQNYGEDSWELDALNPRVIHELLDSAILSVIDQDQFATDKAIEDAHRKELETVRDNWQEAYSALHARKEQRE